MHKFLLGFLLVLAVAVVSLVCGIGCLAVSIMVLMSLGSQHHGNYEYYGNYPLLYLGPGVAGLLFPWVVAGIVWGVNRVRQAQRRENERTT